MITAARLPWKTADFGSPLPTVVLSCIVAAVCYQADGLASVLGIPPDHIASFWSATPFLVAVMLLTPRKIWPALVVAGLAAIAFHDFQNSVPIGSTIWDSVGNAAEVLVATLGIRLAFKGAPELSSVKSLAKYFAIAVILAPCVSALLGANYSLPGEYWLEWRIWFFADALGYLTVTIAIITWVQDGREWARKPLNYLELAALIIALGFCGFLAFTGTGRMEQPALLYSLVPILLWAALRLGIKGVSTSMVVVVFLSTWGSAHDRGPFTGLGPLNNVLSLQLFLFFAAMPFMVLAVLVEDHKRGQQALLDEDAKLTEAQRLAEFGSWQWDPSTDAVTWSAELYRIAGYDPTLSAPSFKDHDRFFTPESWARLNQSVEAAIRTGAPYELDLEAVRPDGAKLWVTSRGAAVFDDGGRPIQLRGTIQNISERKRAEEARIRHAAIVESSDDAIISKDLDGIIQSWNAAAQRLFGFTEAEAVGRPITIIVPPELFDEEHEILQRLRAGEHIEHYETLRIANGGKKLNVSLTISPIRDSVGRIVAISKIARDITHRKATEAALEQLSGRLINAQEQERARIARELHDDFSQRLALQGVGLGQLLTKLPESELAGRNKVEELLKSNRDLSKDIHSLSHQLHSSKLEHVGLASALKSLCEQYSAQYEITVEFTSREVPSDISKEVALCLFRIAQEALNNVVKHSHVKEARAELFGDDNQIRLRIKDEGSGFDPAIRGLDTGIGLVSMRERLRLVGGTLLVRSAPARGTEIVAQVPRSVRVDHAHAAPTAPKPR
ncbi:MAG: PAS domain S-box protein [Candidatus Acidiferrales bacterium]